MIRKSGYRFSVRDNVYADCVTLCAVHALFVEVGPDWRFGLIAFETIRFVASFSLGEAAEAARN
jgi:hypothetical protein